MSHEEPFTQRELEALLASGKLPELMPRSEILEHFDFGDLLDPAKYPTHRIAVAGMLLDNLGKQQSYAASQSGFLPTVQINAGRKVVPTAALRRMLALDEPDASQNLDAPNLTAA